MPTQPFAPLMQRPSSTILSIQSIIKAMMRLPTIVTLLTLVSAILSAASADNSKDADAIGQSGSLRGAGTDTSIHQSLLKAIEADELGEFDASDLVLVRMNSQNS
jgi:hypothetical protein